jgi:hypothetical protein
MQIQTLEQVLMSDDDFRNIPSINELEIVDKKQHLDIENPDEEDEEEKKKRKRKIYSQGDEKSDSREAYKQDKKIEKYGNSNTAEFMDRLYSDDKKKDQPLRQTYMPNEHNKPSQKQDIITAQPVPNSAEPATKSYTQREQRAAIPNLPIDIPTPNVAQTSKQIEHYAKSDPSSVSLSSYANAPVPQGRSLAKILSVGPREARSIKPDIKSYAQSEQKTSYQVREQPQRDAPKTDMQKLGFSASISYKTETLAKDTKKEVSPSYKNASKTILADHRNEPQNHTSHMNHGYSSSLHDLHAHASYAHNHANHDHESHNHKHSSPSEGPVYNNAKKHGDSCGCGACYVEPTSGKGNSSTLITGLKMLKK